MIQRKAIRQYSSHCLLVCLLFLSNSLTFAADIKKLRSLADQAATTHGIDPYLLHALVHQESRWKPNAVSPGGAVGLTQLRPSTAKAICGLSRQELKNPEKNLHCGAMYLAQQIKRFGEVKKALCAYNAGPTITAKLGRCPNYRITRNYVRNIMNHWRAKQVAQSRTLALNEDFKF